MTDDNALPELLREIAEVAGEPAALAIAAKFGGRRAYFRQQMLAAVVGDAAATKIMGAFGAGLIEIPKAHARTIAQRNAEIIAAHLAGESQARIALRFNLTERHVRGVITAARSSKSTPAAPRRTATGRQPAPGAQEMQYIGPNHATERRFIREPQRGDWLELREALAIARGKGALDKRAAGIHAEDWDRMSDDDRRRAWHSAQIQLLDAERMRKQFPTTR